MNLNELIEFAKPYYEDKDIMHDMWHIELVCKSVDKILKIAKDNVNTENLLYATYFHGFIYSHELDIREWLTTQGLSQNDIDMIVKISYDSQRFEIPETIEGKILHDAHLIEGGKTYIITKCLISGSVRGQTLLETISYIEENVLDKGVCYLPEAIPLLAEANEFAREFVAELKKGVGESYYSVELELEESINESLGRSRSEGLILPISWTTRFSLTTGRKNSPGRESAILSVNTLKALKPTTIFRHMF